MKNRILSVKIIVQKTSEQNKLGKEDVTYIVYNAKGVTDMIRQVVRILKTYVE